jgi:hypothetical protein
MAAIPIFILDKGVIPRLKTGMQQFGLDIQEIGEAKSTLEGTEQRWKCCDEIGSLFYFSTNYLNEQNGLKLRAGTFCLIPGPKARGRYRKDITKAFGLFERALDTLGTRQDRVGRLSDGDTS